MHEPMDILEPTLAEAHRVLQEMKNTKDLAQRQIQSAILKNLCESADVFFALVANAMASEDFPDFLDVDPD